jgi:type I restriction enzyme, S subunit
MSRWKKIRIGNFLTERKERYKPDDKVIKNYRRLDKIDFSGTICLSDKSTKTDMILVYPDDLVISGINVEKGALAVYHGQEPVAATIHYSSYIFNNSIVDIHYFRYFVKSSVFVSTLKDQVKDGIKTEIKAKHLLSLEIKIPDLPEQRRIIAAFSKNEKSLSVLTTEIEKQKKYLKLLRQSILEDSVEGKLTAEWRTSHPVIKGNPEFDAESLYEKIQNEKAAAKTGKKKQTKQDTKPISEGDIPFEIPDGWK